jgi:hypothetical protein
MIPLKHCIWQRASFRPITALRATTAASDCLLGISGHVLRYSHRIRAVVTASAAAPTQSHDFH